MSDSRFTISKMHHGDGETIHFTAEVPMADFDAAMARLREFDNYIKGGQGDGSQGETGNEGQAH